MNWTDGISNALKYIEEHLKEDIKIVDVANEAYVSSFYFQKAFRILCGFSVAEYIRYRRLSLAGSEVITTNKKIIEIALEYGYDSPDSFTKAFTRFHGVTPTVARKEQLMIKSFAPLKIQFTLKGGSTMDYKIIEKEASRRSIATMSSAMSRYSLGMPLIRRSRRESCVGSSRVKTFSKDAESTTSPRLRPKAIPLPTAMRSVPASSTITTLLL